MTLTDDDINKVETYLKNRNENDFARRLLLLIESQDQKAKEYLIRKSINYKVLQKILSGELNG